jgi:hypothetical protein
MDISLGGITKKLEDNALILAFAASAFERFNGDINTIIGNYTNFGENGVGGELRRTLTDLGTLKYKLLNSPHLYTGIFKGGIAIWLLAEMGIIPSKYGKLGKDLLMGSGIAAVTLPASGGGADGSSGGGSHPAFLHNGRGWAGHFTMPTRGPTPNLSTPVAGVPPP